MKRFIISWLLLSRCFAMDRLHGATSAKTEEFSNASMATQDPKTVTCPSDNTNSGSLCSDGTDVATLNTSLGARKSDDETTTISPVVCGTESCGGDRARNQCGCDEICAVHGDCCPEYTPPELTRPNPSIQCTFLYISANWFLLVSKCPSNWGDQYVRDMCERKTPGYHRYYLIPVLVLETGVSYKNMFCAFCHGYHLSDIKHWTYKIRCNKNLSTGDPLHWVIKKNCMLAFTEPSRRPCKTALTCETANVNSSASLHHHPNFVRCQIFVNYITTVDYVVYKNLDCAMCLNRSISQIRCSTLKNSNGGWTPEFSRLFDYTLQFKNRGNKNVKVDLEERLSCEKEGQEFYNSMCRFTKCGYNFLRSNGLCHHKMDIRSYVFIICQSIQQNMVFTHARRYTDMYSSKFCMIGEKSTRLDIKTITNSTMFRMVIEEMFEKIAQYDIRKMSFYSQLPERLYAWQHATNCTIGSFKGGALDVINGTLNIIRQVATKDWPWYVEFNYTKSENHTMSGNTTVTAEIQICSMLKEACPFVRLNPQRYYSHLIDKMKLYMWKYVGPLYAMCHDKFLEIVSEELTERNRNLQRVMHTEFARLEEKRRSMRSSGDRVFGTTLLLYYLGICDIVYA